jgi:Protein of unknown function (DUF2892)
MMNMNSGSFSMSKLLSKANLGVIDRVIRACIAFGVIKQGLNTGGLSGLLMVVSGIGILASSITATCPMMTRFGISTRPEDSNYVGGMAKKLAPIVGIAKFNEQSSPKYVARNRKGVLLHTLADLLTMS